MSDAPVTENPRLAIANGLQVRRKVIKRRRLNLATATPAPAQPVRVIDLAGLMSGALTYGMGGNGMSVHADSHAGGTNGHDLPNAPVEMQCAVGEPLQFGSFGVGTTGMISGWADPEEGHNWNNGKESAFAISTRAPVPRLTLDIVGVPYITQLRPAQEMTVYGNGFRLGYKRMSTHGQTRLTILLLPQWWFVEGDRATMHLVFHLPFSVRPKDIGDNEDGRELGFAFQSLCLRDSGF